MRFMMLTGVAVAGLLLLAWMFSGDSSPGFQQGSSRQDAAIGGSTGDPAADTGADALLRLQQQMMTQHDVALAGKPAPDRQNDTPAVTNPAPDAPSTVNPTPGPAAVTAAPAQQDVSSAPAPAAPAPAASAPAVPAPAAPATAASVVTTAPEHQDGPSTTNQTSGPPSAAGPREPIVIPERHEAAAAEPTKSLPMPPPEPAKPTPRDHAVRGRPPSPPPLPPRQESDDATSVLARLRQQARSSDRPPDKSPPIERNPPQAESSSLPQLTAARAALASGRVEDARRLLQKAQLRLVFRPAASSDDGPSLAGKGATDVARALAALSTNDIPLGRRYIDIAMGDLSGHGTTPSTVEPETGTPGYAPAYPPR